MSFQPFQHQLEGVCIMKNMEDEGCGGFLADGMGMGKCLAPLTKVLLWQGGWRYAKDIREGDLLVGDDSTCRTVMSTCHGHENMYTIKQTKGEDYVVNEPHILSLRASQHKSISRHSRSNGYTVMYFDHSELKYKKKTFGSGSFSSLEEAYQAALKFQNTIDNNDILDIAVKDYLKLSKTTKAFLKGFKVGVEWKPQPVFMDPYLLGVWLGDGHSSGDDITNVDKEILDDIRTSLSKMECDLIQTMKEITYRISGTKRGYNPFRQALDFYNLKNNKHIPTVFLQNSKDIRLEVLAGLIDTDGYLTDCCFEITQKNKQLADDIAYLARSLGFYVSFRSVKKYCIYKGEKKEGIYYKCIISGNGISEIPTRLKRKQSQQRIINKDNSLTSIYVEFKEHGEYYGFTLDGNRRFLLHDFTVTHNTANMSMFLAKYKLSKPDLIVCPVSLLGTWEREILKVQSWDGQKRRVPRILIYHGFGRADNLKRGKWDYVITTYYVLGEKEFGDRQWGRIVLDESHTIKNGLTEKGPKCAQGAYEIMLNAEYRWCISGTPFCNRMKDIAAQCKFVGTAPYNDPLWWRRYGDDKDLTDEWRAKYVLRRTKEGMLEKPTYHDLAVDPTDQEARLIGALRAQAADEFRKWKKAKGFHKIQLQARILGLIQKLRIFSNSFYSSAFEKDEESAEPDQMMDDCAKVEHLVNDIAEYVAKDPRKGVVVFSQFTSFFNILEQCLEFVLPEVEIMKFTGEMGSAERDAVITAFNEGEHARIILVSLMAGGVGLSLHYGSSTVVLCENYYNPFIEQQAEERVHRLGQKHQVNVYRYSMTNSVETWIDGLKRKKLLLAANLELGKKGVHVEEFNFDDIADLFADHVMFVNSQGTPLKKAMEEAEKKDKAKPKAP